MNEATEKMERTMENFAMRTVLAAIVFGLVIAGVSDARADQSGDPGLCLGGWFFVPAATVAFDDFFGFPYLTGEHWACRSDGE